MTTEKSHCTKHYQLPSECPCSLGAAPPLAWLRAHPWTAATCGHLEELRSLLTQSSCEVVSPFPTMLQVLLFFLRGAVPSPSDPESHSESDSDELELEELEESLELSEAMPVDSWRSTASARTASSGCSCFKIPESWSLQVRVGTQWHGVAGGGLHCRCPCCIWSSCATQQGS